MGADLCARWPAARSIYDRISALSGVDLASLSFNGDVRPLLAVENAHLAIFTHSIAVNALLRLRAMPDVAAGHSLGLLAAATAAGAISLEGGTRLVKRRGELLRDACRAKSGGMAAVRGLPLAVIEAAAKAAGPGGAVCVANHNGKNEFVLSGERDSLQLAIGQLRQKGAAIRPLAVAGAFHSPLMTSAAEAYGREVRDTEVNAPLYPLVSSSTGTMLRSAGEIAAELADNILSPVRWDLVLERLARLRIDRRIEVGPGKILTSFSLQWDRRAQAHSTSNAIALARACETLDRCRAEPVHGD